LPRENSKDNSLVARPVKDGDPGFTEGPGGLKPVEAVISGEEITLVLVQLLFGGAATAFAIFFFA
jgi:hypothetical protein